jgi:hypothetical protein
MEKDGSFEIKERREIDMFVDDVTFALTQMIIECDDAPDQAAWRFSNVLPMIVCAFVRRYAVQFNGPESDIQVILYEDLVKRMQEMFYKGIYETREETDGAP